MTGIRQAYDKGGGTCERGLDSRCTMRPGRNFKLDCAASWPLPQPSTLSSRQTPLISLLTFLSTYVQVWSTESINGSTVKWKYLRATFSDTASQILYNAYYLAVWPFSIFYTNFTQIGAKAGDLSRGSNSVPSSSGTHPCPSGYAGVPISNTNQGIQHHHGQQPTCLLSSLSSWPRAIKRLETHTENFIKEYVS